MRFHNIEQVNNLRPLLHIDHKIFFALHYLRVNHKRVDDIPYPDSLPLLIKNNLKMVCLLWVGNRTRSQKNTAKKSAFTAGILHDNRVDGIIRVPRTAPF